MTVDAPQPRFVPRGRGTRYLARPSSRLLVTAPAALLLISGTALGTTWKPPFPGLAAVDSHHHSGCTSFSIRSVTVATGEVETNSTAKAGSVIPACPTSSLNTTLGFESPRFSPTSTGPHKVTFKWGISWNATLKAACGRAGCSQAHGALTLLGSLGDDTTGRLVHGVQILVWSGSVANASSQSFGGSGSNFTLSFSANLNGTHAYHRLSTLVAQVRASAPAGGLPALSRLNVGSGSDGAWLLSVAVK